jgi:hypothetical protein
VIRAAVTFALALALAPSAEGEIVIVGDAKLGRFEVKRDGTLEGVIQAFGRPASLRRADVTCYARWPAIRLRITFYNLGGQNPAGRSGGHFSRAEIVGRTGRREVGFGSVIR